MARNTHLGPAARYFKLQPEEEELVERLLKEGDEDGMAGNDGLSTSNPFDLQLVAVGGAAESQGFDMARDTIKQMAAIESQLSGLAQDHLFDEAGSLIDFRSLASGRDGAATERPASASTRLTEETSAPPAPVPVAAAPSVGGASPPSAASGRGEGSRKPAGAYGERSAAGSVVSTQSHSVVRGPAGLLTILLLGTAVLFARPPPVPSRPS